MLIPLVKSVVSPLSYNIYLFARFALRKCLNADQEAYFWFSHFNDNKYVDSGPIYNGRARGTNINMVSICILSWKN